MCIRDSLGTALGGILHYARWGSILVIRGSLLTHHLVIDNVIHFRGVDAIAGDARMRRLQRRCQMVAIRDDRHLVYYMVVILPFLVVVFNVLHRLIVVLVVVRTTLAVRLKRLN